MNIHNVYKDGGTRPGKTHSANHRTCSTQIVFLWFLWFSQPQPQTQLQLKWRRAKPAASKDHLLHLTLAHCSDSHCFRCFSHFSCGDTRPVCFFKYSQREKPPLALFLLRAAICCKFQLAKIFASVMDFQSSISIGFVGTAGGNF